jgi:hypothetical protein
LEKKERFYHFFNHYDFVKLKHSSNTSPREEGWTLYIMKKIFAIVLILVVTLAASAQSVSPFFTAMPNYIFPYLSLDNRKDMIDLFKANKIAKVENLLKGISELKSLNDDFIVIQLNSGSMAQVKLLPLSDTTRLIAVVKTVMGNASDSKVMFFTSTWKTIDAKPILPAPQLSWFIDASKIDPALINSIDIEFYTYAFNPLTTEISVSLDAENYLSKEDFQKISPALRSPIVLKWINGRFVKE